MKHPVLENRARLIVWWLVWILVGLGQSLLFYYAFGSFTQVIIPDILISFIVYSGIALAIWYPFSFFNTAITNRVVLVSNFVAAGALVITLWSLASYYITGLVLPDETGFRNYWEITFPYRIGTGVFIYGLIILTYYLFVSLTNLAAKNAREAKLESLVKETELKMLRSQINPHFLFNSLNSVSSLTVTDPEKARTMVIKLSEFMRYALSRKDEKPVTLRSELENLRLYLDIEKVRFGDRLRIEEDIDPSCLGVSMPVMILQPLYENAIKHGVYETNREITVYTSVVSSGDHVLISIENNYDPEAAPARGTGTGLSNVARRLELMYGKKATINTEKEKDHFSVKIYIPASISS